MNATEQLKFIMENVRLCRPQALEKMIKIIEDEADHYDDKECFMLHDCIDNFYYVITYKDGKRYTDYIGEKAYRRYIDDDDAVRIERKSKDLFPVFELLLEKC